LGLPFALCLDIPALEEDPFRPAGQLYTVLAATGRELHWDEQVTARMPTPDDAQALRIPNGIPLLVTRRITRDQQRHALILEDTRRTAEDTALGYELKPSPLENG
jgi:GntR family transcriptional regulator